MMSNFLNKFFLKLNNNITTNSEIYADQLSNDLVKLRSNFNTLNAQLRDVFQAEINFLETLNKAEEDNKNIMLIYYHLIRLLSVINNLKLNYCIKDVVNKYNETLKNLASFELWIINVIRNAQCLLEGMPPNDLIFVNKPTTKIVTQFNQVDLQAIQWRFLTDTEDFKKTITRTTNTYCNFVRLMAVSEEVRDEASSLQVTRNDLSNFEKSKALFNKLKDSGSPVSLALEKDLIKLHLDTQYLPAHKSLEARSIYYTSISNRYKNKYKTLVNSLRGELDAKTYGAFRRFFSKKVYEDKVALVGLLHTNAAGDLLNPAECFNGLQNLLRQTSFLDRTIRKVCTNYSNNLIAWLVNRNVFNNEILDNIVNIFLNEALSSEYIKQIIPKLIENFAHLNSEQKIKFIWRLNQIESKQGKLMPQLKSLILSTARIVSIEEKFNFNQTLMNGQIEQVEINLKKLILRRNTYAYQKPQQIEQRIQLSELLSSDENAFLKDALYLDHQVLEDDQIKTAYLDEEKLTSLEVQLLEKLKKFDIQGDKLSPAFIHKVKILVADQPNNLLLVTKLIADWNGALQRFKLRQRICNSNQHSLLWLLTRELTIDFIVASKVDVAEFKQASRTTYQVAGRLVSSLPLSLIENFQGSEEFKRYSLEPSLKVLSFTHYHPAEFIAEDIAAELIHWLGDAVKKIQPEDLGLFVDHIKIKIFLILSDKHQLKDARITTHCLERITQPLSAQAHQFMLAKLNSNFKTKQFEEILCANQYQQTLVNSNQNLHEQIEDITAENKRLMENLEQFKQQLAEKDKQIVGLAKKSQDLIELIESNHKDQQEQTAGLAKKLQDEISLREGNHKDQQAQANLREGELKAELNQAVSSLQAELAAVASTQITQQKQNSELADGLNHLKVQQEITSSKLMALEANVIIQSSQSSKINQSMTDLERQRQKLSETNAELKTQLLALTKNHAEQGEHFSQRLDSLGIEQAGLKMAYVQSDSGVVQQAQQTQQEIQSIKQQVEQLSSDNQNLRKQLQEIGEKLWSGFKQDFDQLKNDLLANNDNKLKQQAAAQAAIKISDIKKTGTLEVTQEKQSAGSAQIVALVAGKAGVSQPGYVSALREFIKVEQEFHQRMRKLHEYLLQAKEECMKNAYAKYDNQIKKDLFCNEIISVFAELANDALNVANLKYEDMTKETFPSDIQRLREAVISPDFLVNRLANLHKATLYYEHYFGTKAKLSKDAFSLIKMLDTNLKTSASFIEYSLVSPFQMCTRIPMQITSIYDYYEKNQDKDSNAQCTLTRLKQFFKEYADKVNDFNKQTIDSSANNIIIKKMQQLDSVYRESTAVEKTPGGTKHPGMVSQMFKPAPRSGGSEKVAKVLAFNM